jgi:predicted membrane protein
MDSSEQRHAPHLSGRLMVGVILLGLGALFLLDSFDLLDAGRFRDYWPVILIMWGIGTLMDHDRGRRGRGLILVALGCIFLLRNLHILYVPWRAFWPIVLVLLGGNLIWRSLRRPRQILPGDAATASGVLSEFAIMGGGGRVVRSRQFRGGELTAIMGGFDIDLREAELAPEGAHVEVFVMMGGIDFKVPENWTVLLKVTPILGGTEFKAHVPGPSEAGNRVLTITGVVIMGGVGVKN